MGKRYFCRDMIAESPGFVNAEHTWWTNVNSIAVIFYFVAALSCDCVCFACLTYIVRTAKYLLMCV